MRHGLNGGWLLGVAVLALALGCSSSGDEDGADTSGSESGGVEGGGAPTTCGNGAIDPGEACDGTALNDATCESIGFGPGELACGPTCQALDPANCGASATCGDGAIDGTDVCDGADLGGATCESEGFGAGDLTCAANCAGFDTSACAAPATCGNGAIDGIEVCDGSDLGGQTCEGIGLYGGDLACADSCTEFDESGCITECPVDCGGLECGPDPLCGESCGTCDVKSACEEGICVQICDLLSVEEDTVWDVDLPVVDVSGEIRINGAMMPSNSQEFYELESRGAVFFRNLDTQLAEGFTVGHAGAAQFEGRLFAGRYRVEFDGGQGAYQNAVPDQNVLLIEEVVIESDWSENFDLDVIEFNGEVTLNGQMMPSNTQEFYELESRGTITLARADTGSSFGLSVGPVGAAQFGETIFSGVYQVSFDGNNRAYQNVVPDQTLILDEERTINGAATNTFDLQTVTYQGEVTLNGEQIPDNTQEFYELEPRASLVLTRQDSGSSMSTSLGAFGPGDFEFDIFAGTYEVAFDGDSESYQNAVPDVRKILGEGVALVIDTETDWNIDTVTLTGIVTLNGGTVPSNTQEFYEFESRGEVGFRDKATGYLRWGDVGFAGIASYEVELLAGTYDVLFDGGSGSYQNAVPDQTVRLQSDQVFSTSTQVDLDLRTATVSGEVLINGEMMAGNTQEFYELEHRGEVEFRRADTGSVVSASLGSQGPATYEVELYEGTYAIQLDPYSPSYQNAIPGMTTTLELSTPIATDATLSWDLPVVNLSGTVTVNGEQMADNTTEFYELEPRGGVAIRNVLTGSEYHATVGAFGPATYSAEVFAGTYDLVWDSASPSYQNAVPGLELVAAKGCLGSSACVATTDDLTGTWYVTTKSGFWPDFTLEVQHQGDELSVSYASSQGQAGTWKNVDLKSDQVFFEFQLPACPVQGQASLTTGCLMQGTMACATSTSFTAIRLN